jgi:hypothetical protein
LPVPTVLRIDGYRFYFYSHEPNEPPHVHVDRAEYTAKIWLEEVAGTSAFGRSSSMISLPASRSTA